MKHLISKPWEEFLLACVRYDIASYIFVVQRSFQFIVSQVGAWGCFDEFNRLEERMLSAVSQQVQTIQEALKSQKENKKEGSLVIELVGKQVKVSQDMAIFITMNPGYAGRSNLPDNLKKLFRSLAMTTPDRQLIAEIVHFSQGFKTAEKLAQKIVPYFKLGDEQLSNQSLLVVLAVNDRGPEWSASSLSAVSL